MDILDEEDTFEENSEIFSEKIEENVENEVNFDPDKVLEEEISELLPKKVAKNKGLKCSRCNSDLGAADKWFNYGISRMQFGYSMLPEPLCKSCFTEFQAFMDAYKTK